MKTIATSDLLMCLDKGKIVNFDTPTTLLDDISSLFYQMVNILQEEERAKIYKKVRRIY